MTQTAVSTGKGPFAAGTGTPTIDRPRWFRPTHRGRVPPLENGDRLSRREFHRRYSRYPEDVRAELIEGTVFMASPVRVEHSSAHADVVAWLVIYRSMNPGVMVCDNGTLILDDDNEVQPDAMVRFASEAGGQSQVKRGYLVGPPEFVAEIAGSSVSMDVHQKREVYRRNGVKEYMVWRIYDHATDWWRLDGGQYVPIEPDESGMYRSVVIPGLVLDGAALIAGDVATVVAAQTAAVRADGAESGG